MSKIATVELTLGENTYVLTSTYRALEQLSSRFGGGLKAIDAIGALNIQAMAQVIQIGTKMPDAEAKGLTKAIYAAGAGIVAKPLVEFIGIVLNGGKPIEEEAPAGDETDAGNA